MALGQCPNLCGCPGSPFVFLVSQRARRYTERVAKDRKRRDISRKGYKSPTALNTPRKFRESQPDFSGVLFSSSSSSSSNPTGLAKRMNALRELRDVARCPFVVGVHVPDSISTAPLYLKSIHTDCHQDTQYNHPTTTTRETCFAFGWSTNAFFPAHVSDDYSYSCVWYRLCTAEVADFEIYIHSYCKASNEKKGSLRLVKPSDECRSWTKKRERDTQEIKEPRVIVLRDLRTMIPRRQIKGTSERKKYWRLKCHSSRFAGEYQ